MSFGTTLLSLTLAAQSISEGTRYRRRGAHDRLGHIAYGPSHELFIYDT